MTDIAELGLSVRSDGVVVATNRLKDLTQQSKLAEAASKSLRAAIGFGIAGFAALGVGIGAAVKRMEDMDRMSRQVDQALKNSGNSAKTSATEIEAWADSLEKRTGRAAEEVMAVSANLASFSFGRTEFFRSLELANDMASAWGGDLKQNLEGLARALADPEKGLAMLTKRGITFTEEQKKMIDGFLKLNDLAGAQGVVFDALEQQVKGVAEKGYGGLTRAWGLAQKAWEDGFEAMVRGEGQAGDLRDSLEDLAASVSSPEMISGVVGLGNVVVRVLNGIAQVAVGAMNAFKQLMAYLNASGGPMEALNQATGALSGRTTENLKAQIDKREKVLADPNSSYIDKAGFEKYVADLKAELASRSDATKFNINGTFDSLNTPQYEGKDALIAGLNPGSTAAFAGGNPYGDFKYTDKDAEKAGAKAEKAYAKIIRSSQQFIEQQGLEASALGMTEEAASKLRYTQELLNDAANANIKLSPDQQKELAGLAASMAAAEEKTRQLSQAYEFGKSTFGGFFADLKSELMNGTSLWDGFANAGANALNKIADKALGMAADGIWDMIFGSFMGGGTSTGGVGGILSGLFGGGRANGGPVEAGKFYKVNENTPNSEYFAPAVNGTIIPSLPKAPNQNQANDNRPLIQIIDQRTRGGSIKQEETTGANGEKQLRLIIRDEVTQAQRRGAVGF